MNNMKEVQPKTEQVKEMFDNIAPTYDSLNHILSLSIDKVWMRRVVRSVRRLGAKSILDVATGTGDLAIAMARKIEGSTICGVDLSPQMLEVARTKVAKQGLEERITLMEGNAEQLELNSESVDAVTCNPPYFKYDKNKSLINEDEEKAIARHEITMNLEELMTAAKYILKNKAPLCAFSCFPYPRTGIL